MASPVTNSCTQQPPSIRTLSTDSTVIQSSLSPTSTLASSSYSGPGGLGIYSATSPGSPTSLTSSPAERNFFGVLVQKARDRSRSRSRTRVHRSRSRSPMPSRTNAHHYYAQPEARQPSYMAAPPQPRMEPRRLESRSSTSSSEDFYYGRHANQWLFGNFSIRDTVRDVCTRSSSDKSRK